MYKKNDELFKTLNPKILNEKYINLFGKSKLAEITLYPDLQKRILNLEDSKIQILEKVLKYSEQEEWENIFRNVVDSFENVEYEKLYENVLKDENMTSLNKKNMQNLINIVCNEENFFEIKTIEDVKNYSNIRKNTCENILNNYRSEELPQKIKQMTESERIRFATLEMLYGIDNNKAKKLLQVFGKDIKKINKMYQKKYKNDKKINLEKVPNEINFVLAIDNILNGDIEKVRRLKTIQNEYSTSVEFNIEAKLKKYYAKMYNNTFFKTEDKKTDILTEYDRTKIPVYNAGTNFNMNVHVIGAYNPAYKAPVNFKDDWNMPKMGSRHFCTSYIGNNFIGFARTKWYGNMKGPTLGFANLAPESLLASASRDIGSESSRKEFGRFNSRSPDFLTPKEMINNTRHGHNEMDYERMFRDEDGNFKKQQPSYIVYTTTENNEEEYKTDPYWIQTKRAAKEFGVPIVIINKDECAKEEQRKCEKRLEKFQNMNKDNLDTNLINEMITEFGNNRAGSQYDDYIFNNYFSNEKYKCYIDNIVHSIKNNTQITFQQKKECLDKITQSLNNELGKLHREGGGIKVSDEVRKFSSTYKEFIDTITIEEKVINATNKVQEKSESKTDNAFTKCINNANKKTNITIDSESIQNVKNAVEEIENLNIYDQKAHSIRHIQNVILFSELLAENEKISKEDKKLLIEAAKFHDSGRLNDKNEEHSERSAKIAGQVLTMQGNYKKDEINIIKTAIIYHELNERTIGKLDEELCKATCKQNNIKPKDYGRTMKICELLKDADALDRTRFSNKATLNKEYLRSNTAKKEDIIKFAEEINEEYAKSDINEYVEKHLDVDRNEIQEEANKTNAKETIKKIRTGEYVPSITCNMFEEKAGNVSIERKNAVVRHINFEVSRKNKEEEKEIC